MPYEPAHVEDATRYASTYHTARDMVTVAAIYSRHAEVAVGALGGAAGVDTEVARAAEVFGYWLTNQVRGPLTAAGIELDRVLFTCSGGASVRQPEAWLGEGRRFVAAAVEGVKATQASPRALVGMARMVGDLLAQGNPGQAVLSQVSPLPHPRESRVGGHGSWDGWSRRGGLRGTLGQCQPSPSGRKGAPPLSSR